MRAHTHIVQGEEGDKFFIILDGSVKCTSSKAEGKDVDLLTLKPSGDTHHAKISTHVHVHMHTHKSIWQSYENGSRCVAG